KDPRKFHVPLAVMYMKNDPTIYPPAAISFFHRWGAQDKVLIPVSIDGDAEEHVFTGQLGGPHRTDWTISQFSQFLDRILV
ncbi:MAG: hypothetical protein KDI36_17970, partial [Pseudomonadales bacterium]|nr:hypothetical protein [Pseudomonadales bacterium]